MKARLTFGQEKMQVGNLGRESAFPDILSGLNVQNKTAFELEEGDEIYEGYGRIDNAYPYRPYACYDRKTKEREVKTAVLENDFLRAVFLPEYGGRLWRLTDRKKGENLLYTNDVIRPSNLATRNAWFSGGVEWNIGIIGHTPLTMEPLFTAVTKTEKGEPVLRMYEYERIRRVVYQMDFWLEEKSSFLNCRMRIVNGTSEVVPMYWWSNMAVPEYEEGRILLPAQEAYTSDLNKVFKVDIPMVNGTDVSKYNQIPDQVDYFFHIPSREKKYITNLNREGYGLLHLSTSRLQSRKLFTWGHNDASHRWQEFLTEKAGDYIEIQAGLGKTQYGCIPMAPHTAWEWMEQYGPVQVDKRLVSIPFEEAVRGMDAIAAGCFEALRPEEKLEQTGGMAKTKGHVLRQGSGYGNLADRERKSAGEKGLPEHLDFASGDSRQKGWEGLLKEGCLNCPGAEEIPVDFSTGDFWLRLLQESVEKGDKENWYAHYQLGLQYLQRKETEKARKECDISNRLEPNPWAEHVLAVCAVTGGDPRAAVRRMEKAMRDHWEELSMVKECFRLFLQAEAYEEILTSYERLSYELRMESRIRFDYVQALAGTGKYEEAYAVFMENGGLEPADMREGDTSLDKLWKELCEAMGEDGSRPIPHKFNFTAL